MIKPQLIEVSCTAGVKDRVADKTPQEKEEHSYFRTQVGRLLFLSVLRPDLQYAVGQLARHASAPTVLDRIALKRLSAVADADWAGLAERRSVTGGVVLLAGCCVASWSRTQASNALNSCESELCAMGSAAVELLGAHAFLVEQGSRKSRLSCGETVRRLYS